eukprot:CAMPEP_0179062054 /NCGR_PEP_ID=MMETSP0796-20121207/26734_1 /TAXON_ID=73915 /ORGANISM="Pyrodinium bahamense, Strain pbaha01" /LENGTH=245 /DNA_ID=CAMNT_0020758957 /DNA_START=1 /DNA_END=735 /DNA_ORIENTATION=-
MPPTAAAVAAEAGGGGGGARATPDPAAALAQLAEALGELAPRLAPCPVSAPAAEAALGRLYGAEDVEPLLREFDERSATCSLCGGTRSTSSGSCGLEWTVDVARRRMAPARCLALCGPCGSVRDLPGLIVRLTRQLTAKEEDAGVQSILLHFLRANGHDVADAHCLQDAVSVAHAMFVLHKELRPSLVQGPPVRELLNRASAPSCGAPAAAPARGARGKEAAAESGEAPAGQKRRRRRPPRAAVA